MCFDNSLRFDLFFAHAENVKPIYFFTLLVSRYYNLVFLKKGYKGRNYFKTNSLLS